MDRFENEVLHFLDIKLSLTWTSSLPKKCPHWQYVNFKSYTPWNYKISWIPSFFTRAKQT